MGSLHAFHSCNFFKMRPKPSHRIALRRARLISTIGWRSKRAVGRRGRQKTLPFTGLIVSTVSSTSYTTVAWQTGWTARHKHRQMHAGLALHRLTVIRGGKKRHSKTQSESVCVRWPPNGERSDPARLQSTHARTYICTHHPWVTGSLVAPQPLYLDKLISHFKALCLKNSFHGFPNRCSLLIRPLLAARWQRLNAGGPLGWGGTNPSSHHSAPPGGPGGVLLAVEDV